MSIQKNPIAENYFVGLDLSLTSTGFSIKCGSEVRMRTIKTTPKTAANHLARLEYIRDDILNAIPRSTAMICIEDYFVPRSPMQMGSAADLIGLGLVVRVALYDTGIPFFIPANTQLKKFATGNGSTNQKSLVVREVYKRWGLDAKDDNQADSAVLAFMAEQIHRKLNDGDISDLPKFQVEVVNTVIENRENYNVTFPS